MLRCHNTLTPTAPHLGLRLPTGYHPCRLRDDLLSPFPLQRDECASRSLLCLGGGRRKCWWAVPPRADTLVLFRSERVLHKVTPCHHAPRVAITVFLSASTEEAERAALARIVGGFV